MDCNNEKKITDTQYPIVANEYISALQGSQTVIVINLAISIGILAAMTTMLATGNFITMINLITLIVLSNVGLLGTLCCILTLYVSRKQLIEFQEILSTYEEANGMYNVHQKKYYKPLHYTLFGFWVFTFTFAIVMSVCLVKLFFPTMFCFLSVTGAFAIISLCLFVIVKRIDKSYDYKNKKLAPKDSKPVQKQEDVSAKQNP